MNIKSMMTGLAALVLAMLLVACQSNNQPSTEQPAQPADQGAAKEGAAKSDAMRRRPTTAAAPAARVESVTVPEGTPLEVRLTTGLDTGRTTAGSAFEGTLAAPLAVNGVEVAPAGSRVAGEVSNAVSSGRLNRPAELSLVLTSLAPEGGKPVQISSSTWSAKGASHKKRDAELIGGGAGVGALIGALAGKGKGAAIGAAVGAGAGTAGAAATGKKEIVLPPESKLTFRLTAPVTLEARGR